MDNQKQNSAAQKKDGKPLMASGEPNQQEELDQAERASEASFTLEPEKGLTPDPDHYNKGEDRDDYNIKQIDGDE